MVDEFSSFARMPAPVMQGRGSGRDRAPGGVPATHRDAARSAIELDLPGTPLRAALRCAPGRARRWSTSSRTPPRSIQARDRRRGAGPCRACSVIEDRDAVIARGRGQWPRPAAAGPRAPDRALCDDARQGHRPRVSPSSRKSWKTITGELVLEDREGGGARVQAGLQPDEHAVRPISRRRSGCEMEAASHGA